MTNKILVISYFPDDVNTYPHLNDVRRALTFNAEVEYFHFRLNGIWYADRLVSVLKYPWRKENLVVISDILKLIIKGTKSYKAVIAMDELLYVLSAFLFVKHNNIFLWSFDFITCDQKIFNTPIYRLFRMFFRKALKRRKGLIIQHRERLALLLKCLRLNEDAVIPFYLPISRFPLAQTTLGRISDPIRLLQMGYINCHRSQSHRILEVFQSNSDQFLLILHGHIDSEMHILISQGLVMPLVSNGFIDQADVWQIVQKCDIGYICYCADDENNKHILFASGQLVEYLRCGKPVIIYSNTNLNSFISSERVGIVIDDPVEVPAAVVAIRNDYALYSRNALACYEMYFNLTKYVPQLERFLANSCMNADA